MFPNSHWRDISSFSRQGLDVSTQSDTAVKMFDALIHQAIYHYNDPQLEGFVGTTKRMMEADPEFALGQIFTLGLECFASNPEGAGKEPRKKLFDFSKSATQRKVPLTVLEQGHLLASQLLAAEDWVGAMSQYETVLSSHPLDTASLHMGYLLALVTGHTHKLRDIPAAVVSCYRPSDSFYGHVHGKLSFGESEMGDYKAGEVNGRLALDFFPRDNWAHHAMAHIFEDTGRVQQGSLFLENTTNDWSQGTTFQTHIWWHKALMHIGLGEFETALSLYDEKVGPLSLEDGQMFSLSDGSALLLRLQLEDVDIGDRASEQARAWQVHNGNSVSLFYDGHICFTSLLAGDKRAVEKLKESVRDLVRGERKGFNKEVTVRLGLSLIEGITQFFDGDYTDAVSSLAPVIDDLMSSLSGSRAQKDIFSQLLIHAAIRSGSESDLSVAKNVLEKGMRDRCIDTPSPTHQRLMDMVIRRHGELHK